jgi:GNAT superfamily N-acetyltransferase
MSQDNFSSSNSPTIAPPNQSAWEKARWAVQKFWRQRLRPQWGIPIRALRERHRARVLQHLLALSESDRYLRFGYIANDQQIEHYVAGLNFEREDLLGIFDRRLRLIAVAHLAQSTDPKYLACAEFGVSVRATSRGHGYGGLLFERCVIMARNRGVSMLFIHALSENTAMLKIARKAGATVERHGSESEAHLALPPSDIRSRLREQIEQQAAVANYQLKAQASQFWEFLRAVQEIRQGVRQAKQDNHR